MYLRLKASMSVKEMRDAGEGVRRGDGVYVEEASGE